MLWTDVPRGLTLITAPTAEPLSYAEIKAQLQRNSDEHEALLSDLIVAARQKVEEDTGLKLLSQTWDLTLDAFPDDAIYLPLEPLQSVTSITVTNTAGVAAVVATSNYLVVTAGHPPRIVLSDTGTWPSDIRRAAGIVVRVVVGYSSAALVPRPLVTAVGDLVAVWFAERVGGQYVPVPPRFGYDAKIAPYRRPGVA